MPAQAAQALTDGAWTYFTDPRAAYRDGTVHFGWVASDGFVSAGSYHVSSRRLVTRKLRRFRPDDHGNPAVLVRRDGRLMVFYSAHGGRYIYLRQTSAPGNVLALGRERRLRSNTKGEKGFTYPSPIELRDGTLWLFFRGANFWPSYVTSKPGEGWSKARTLIRGPRRHRPYGKYASDGTSIVTAFSSGHPANYPAGVYFARLRGGSLYRADGRRLGRLGRPLPYQQAERVVAGTSAHRCWVLDVGLDGSGRPVIVYQRREQGSDTYHLVRWTGRQWEDHAIVSAGTAAPDYYAGGATLDHGDPDTVYLARRANGAYLVEAWQTPDGGRTWQAATIARGAQPSLRPVSPRGLPHAVLWFSGRYAGYLSFQTTVFFTPSSSDGP